MEGECPYEPSSAVRKDDYEAHCRAPGGASVCLPVDEQTLVPPPSAAVTTPFRKNLCVSASLR